MTLIEAANWSAMKRFYMPELDALRFFAFLGVFLGHSWAQAGGFIHPSSVHFLILLLQSGEFGVDLFFTLSAYLITELLWRERDRFGSLDVRSFYTRRVLRIWPLYFAFLLLSIPIIRFVPQMAFSWTYYPAFTFFVGNLMIAWTSSPPAVIGPLWSVCVEEQFYLTWPLILKRLSRRGVLIAGVIILIFSTLSRALLVAGGFSDTVLHMGTFARLDPIAAGIILSAILKGERPLLGTVMRLLLYAGGIGMWVVGASLSATPSAAPLAPLSRIFCTSLVALGCVAFMLGTLGIARLNRMFIYLGRISYGLYIFHVMVLDLGLIWIDGFAGWSMWGWAAFSAFELVVTVLISAISYRYYEAPFLRLKERFQRIGSGESLAEPVRAEPAFKLSMLSNFRRRAV